MLCFLGICLAITMQVYQTQVTRVPGYVTQMRYTPALVFLAHNDVSGDEFSKLGYGDVVEVNGDRYIVREIVSMQATEPRNPAADLIDLEDGKRYTAKETWFRIYGHKGDVVLQTCIRRDGEDAWGRLFIIAERDNEQLYEQLARYIK